MTSINPELTLTLDDAVGEVLSGLYGIDLEYDPQYDRYRSITRQLNRAMRDVALEKEWSYFASTQSVGVAVEGVSIVAIPNTMRPRMTGDDAVRLVDADGQIRAWAYFLPRDAIHKYGGRAGLWVANLKGALQFSRGFHTAEEGLDIQVPVMREPQMFRLPEVGAEVDAEIREQPIDFAYPDIVIARAAYLYAQTDPLLQPRVQTLDAQYKDRMYQVIERDDRNTDSPYLNDFFVPVVSGIVGDGYLAHNHPHSDDRRFG